ncbi:MAG: hypothetical protein LBD96_06850 [Treponema sp.]|jgi:hypothetical protein|nr:hypothetical protein [Treponema sp.]
MKRSNDHAGYQKALETLKRAHRGMTAADLSAAAALPLPAAREFLSRAADEFRGRLQVTESSEILYDFPRGFTSRYRSLGARFGRFMDKFISLSLTCLAWIFKVWIGVMLVGYFIIFMLIALAALTLSMAGGSSNSNSRSRNNSVGGFFLASRIFDLIIRLWFYSELTKAMDGSYRKSAPARRGKPLHKAVFSFVFGEPDPNGDADTLEKQALIAYLGANRGLISLPEYMAITGLPPQEAERGILAFCAEFGGSPEATEEGTIVYRFQDILLRASTAERETAAADRGKGSQALRGPLRRLRAFSSNNKTMNSWFGIINSVNLLFGGYFFYQAFNTGIIRTTEQLRASPRIYAITYDWASSVFSNPQPFILVGLGLIPLLFSFFFWLVPALRLARLDGENQNIKKRNLRKIGFGKIWEKPRDLVPAAIDSPAPECRPRTLEAEREKLIVEMGSYSRPDVEADQTGKTIYSFTELEREKKALAAGRAAVNPEDFKIGKVIFDSE